MLHKLQKNQIRVNKLGTTESSSVCLHESEPNTNKLFFKLNELESSPLKNELKINFTIFKLDSLQIQPYCKYNIYQLSKIRC